jgi:hypothetical protein
VAGAALVIGIVGTVAIGVFVSKAVDTVSRNFGTADPADYSVKVDTCDIDPDTGALTATGQFTNKATRRQNFNLTVDFTDDADSSRLGTDTFVQIGALNSNQTANWSASGGVSLRPTGPVKCAIGDVEYLPG